CELAVDLVDQCPDRERTKAERSRSLDDPRVVEVAARQPQEIIAERHHREEGPLLIRRYVRWRVTKEQGESCPERNQGAAELVAQVGQNRSEFPLIDQQASDPLTLDAGGGWCGPDFHGLMSLRSYFDARADRRGHALRVAPEILGDDDLIGQERMAVR